MGNNKINTKKLVGLVMAILVIALLVAGYAQNKKNQEAASIKGQQNANEKGLANSNQNSNLSSDRSTYCVYVADSQNDRVQKFDSDGNYLDQWGSFGTGQGQFDTPTGVGANQTGNIYIVESATPLSSSISHRIQKFDSFGNLNLGWGSYGTALGQFANPQGVAIDALGNVYVVDKSNHRVQKFDSNGNGIPPFQWGGFGTGPGRFRTPRYAAVDSLGYIYVTDQVNGRVQKFDLNGNYILEWPTWNFNSSMGIAINSQDIIYVARFNQAQILTYDTSGNQIGGFGSAGSGSGQFNGSAEIAIDPSDNVYVTEAYNDRVQKFTSTNAFILAFGFGVATGANQFEICTSNCQAGIVGAGNGQFNDPYGIDINSCPPPQTMLTLAKTVINNDGGGATPANWTLSGAGPTPITGISGSPSVTNAVVNPGVYTLSESAGPVGYTASSYSCVINGGPAVVSNSITLTLGDNAVCTITNDDIPVPPLTCTFPTPVSVTPGTMGHNVDSSGNDIPPFDTFWYSMQVQPLSELVLLSPRKVRNFTIVINGAPLTVIGPAPVLFNNYHELLLHLENFLINSALFGPNYQSGGSIANLYLPQPHSTDWLTMPLTNPAIAMWTFNTSWPINPFVSSWIGNGAQMGNINLDVCAP